MEEPRTDLSRFDFKSTKGVVSMKMCSTGHDLTQSPTRMTRSRTSGHTDQQQQTGVGDKQQVERLSRSPWEIAESEIVQAEFLIMWIQFFWSFICNQMDQMNKIMANQKLANDDKIKQK